MDLKDYLHSAIDAAKAAGHIHRSGLGRERDIDTKTNHTDLVTDVDKQSEAKLREILIGRYPDHAFLGEEEGQEGEASHRWIVDPLDGTLNYAHGFPFYCVSIALEIDGEVRVGVVYDSVRDELFSATRGGGAYLNGAPIGVTTESDLKRAMLATGFAYAPETITDNLAVFARVLPKCRSVRRPGAAALDLCYVACGRLDGFWEMGLSPWDVAAGWLIIQEAGGTVTNTVGGPYTLGDKTITASNGHLHGKLLAALELEPSPDPVHRV